MRSAATNLLFAGRAGILAVEIVADIENQVRMRGRGAAGYLLETPIDRVVTILNCAP